MGGLATGVEGNLRVSLLHFTQTTQIPTRDPRSPVSWSGRQSTMQWNCEFRRPAIALGALALALACGCTSVNVTGTPRTGSEQLLLTGTWDGALSGVDFGALAGSRVFLNAEHMSVVDKDWVISSIRRSMAEQGVLLENNKDKAELIVEGAFGAYG